MGRRGMPRCAPCADFADVHTRVRTHDMTGAEESPAMGRWEYYFRDFFTENKWVQTPGPEKGSLFFWPKY